MKLFVWLGIGASVSKLLDSSVYLTLQTSIENLSSSCTYEIVIEGTSGIFGVHFLQCACQFFVLIALSQKLGCIGKLNQPNSYKH